MLKRRITGIEIKPYTERLSRSIIYFTYLVIQPKNEANFISLEGLVKKGNLKHLREEIMGYIPYNVSGYSTKPQSNQRVHLLGGDYFPFSACPMDKYWCLLGKGIADRIDSWIANHLLEFFDEQTQIEFHPKNERRINQLARQGIEINKWYNLKEYNEILQAHISGNR